MKSFWRDGDRVRSVELRAQGPGRWQVVIDDGAPIEVAAEPLGDGRWRLAGAGGSHGIEITTAGDRWFVRLDALDFVLGRERAARGRGAKSHAGGLEAPMPGAVTRVLVAPGDAVTAGQPLVAIEAMKMEHVIRAPRAGTVRELRAKAGDMVTPGVALVELDEEA
jgi:acetyl/propionyl-CoA carboxylase alpha subunit